MSKLIDNIELELILISAPINHYDLKHESKLKTISFRLSRVAIALEDRLRYIEVFLSFIEVTAFYALARKDESVPCVFLDRFLDVELRICLELCA